MIEINTLDDQCITKQVYEGVDICAIKNTIDSDTNNLIFPFCGKHCFNSIKKAPTTSNGDSKYATALSWEGDGSVTKKSSMQILIEWITTEENCSTYFGGLDASGHTNGNRKDTYLGI